MCGLSREEKRQIRKRDAKRIKLTGICSLCGKERETSRHHLFYDKEKFNHAVVLELCNECDCKVHKRDDNDNWVAKLKSVRCIELINSKIKGEYTIVVENKVVGCTKPTENGLQLIITD